MSCRLHRTLCRCSCSIFIKQTKGKEERQQPWRKNRTKSFHRNEAWKKSSKNWPSFGSRRRHQSMEATKPRGNCRQPSAQGNDQSIPGGSPPRSAPTLYYFGGPKAREQKRKTEGKTSRPQADNGSRKSSICNDVTAPIRLSMHFGFRGDM